MKKMIDFLKQHLYLIILLIILGLGLFFRTYKIVERYDYAHDADLFGWIVKDIVVDHHPRLIGQLTSAEGIYIGPVFYYALIPFFLLTNMDPIGALIPITILGMLTLISYYFVFSKLFNRQVGLIITFLQAVLIPSVTFDRWVVPSTPTNIWMVWYFYTVVMLSRGNFVVLPLLAVLISLIWNIHIALAPPLLAIPVAIFLAKKLPSLKQTLIFLVTLFVTSVPLILFEFKHNFLQTTSFIHNLSTNHGGGTGLDKLNIVSLKMGYTITNLYTYPNSIPFIDQRLILALILLLPIILISKKVLTLKATLPLYAWFLGLLAFFVFSSTLVSEYYFANVEIIFTAFLSLSLYLIFKSGKLGKAFVLTLFSLILIHNLYTYTTLYYYQRGYLARKNVVDYIKADASAKGYPCVAISYIASPGENVGFRYLLWLARMHVNLPKSGGPIYSIVIPADLVKYGSLNYQYGHIGVLNPEKVPSIAQMQKNCSIPDQNLTEPVLGFSTN